MNDPAAAQISEAMNRLWQKFLPQIEQRVATMQMAAAKLRSGEVLSPEEQSSAGAEAHKLAGVLGTFGLKEGTDLAREAEGLFEKSVTWDEATAVRLSLIADQVKALIASRG